MSNQQRDSAYLSRGVSSTKEDVHSAIAAHDKGIYPGAFCKIVPDLFGDVNGEYCSIMHTDDVGTKSIIAYIVYKESRDARIFRGIAQDSAVMNLDDMLCVGACGGFVFSNTIGRNAHRIGGDAVGAIINGYADFCKKMDEYGITITMCGGETSDTGDIVTTIFVDSTFYSRLSKSNVIDCSNIKPGNVIVGLSSSGQAAYEDKPNSGIGSNGLTAARHLILSKHYAEKYPESWSQTIDKSKVYCGKYLIGDEIPGAGMTAGEALLSPTRTYAPIIRGLLADGLRPSGMIHCTGGGQVKCRNFGRGLHYIKDNLFETPAIFKAIYESGEISASEMFGVFNMGHRFEVYCDPDEASSVIADSEKYGVKARVIGRVEKSPDDNNRVTISHDGQVHVYGK